jgi:hypothetical protein
MRPGPPHPPISGLPEIGLFSAQVGYSRLAMTRAFGALLRMRRPGGLFADAEIAENHVQDVLDVDPASEPPQRSRSEAQLLGQ